MNLVRMGLLSIMAAGTILLIAQPASSATSANALKANSTAKPAGSCIATPASCTVTPAPSGSPAASASPNPSCPLAKLPNQSPGPWSFLCAFALLLVLYILYAVVSGHPNPLWIAMGADGRLSSSKLQFLGWTTVVLYAYATLAIDRLGHVTCTGAMLPVNVLIAMGLSLTTAAGAKSIAVAYQNAGQNTPDPITPTTSLSYLVMSDNGKTPDLPKIQMLAWTAVAIVVFLIDLVVNYRGYATCKIAGCFPDIDTALMVLMGLGQGAYLGFKLVPMSQADQAAQAQATGGGPSDPDIPLHPGPVQPASPTAGIGKDIAPK
jgi:hypothetical protein